ncbi:MAG TPA: NUDIX domain-containing protein [Acidimicrobiia bacterium]|nr:NUDIX domain-containing protein [Acidimicrobiia bacterium]
MRQWSEQARAQGATPTGVAAVPAATVVLLRDGSTGLEVLLARRSSQLAFHGGAWVFPGGRIDPDDYDETGDVALAARRAAAREAREEAGLHVDADVLVHVSNWTTPEISPKRFATWFFAGPVAGGEEQADGSETDELRWFRPGDALDARAAGDIELAPPQYVTLLELCEFVDVDAALTAIASMPPIDYTPRFLFLDGGAAVCLYDGDVGYDDETRLEEPGPRHRLVMEPDGWVYVTAAGEMRR